MSHVARDVVFRPRMDGRQGRLRWLLAIAAFNIVLWSGLIALISHRA